MRNVVTVLLWVIILLLSLYEALFVIGLVGLLVMHGPRGVVGTLAHAFVEGRSLPMSTSDSDRIFWTYTGAWLALQFTGPFVLWGAWRLQKRLTAGSPQSPQRTH